MLKKVEVADHKFGRLSPMVLSRPSHNRLKQQLIAGKLRKSATAGDLGYHTMVGHGSSSGGGSSSNNSTMETVSAASSCATDLWDVRATKTAIRDLHILTHNAKHTPVSRGSAAAAAAAARRATSSPIGGASYFDFMPDGVIVRILSFLNSNQIILCSRVSRRFYFLAWEPELWREIALTGGGRIDADLALRTIMRLLSRNSAAGGSPTAPSNKLPCVESLSLGGCQRLTDRGLAIVARRCPQLRRLEVQYCGNITNGGIMDLVTKCTYLDHLDVSGERDGRALLGNEGIRMRVSRRCVEGAAGRAGEEGVSDLSARAANGATGHVLSILSMLNSPSSLGPIWILLDGLQYTATTSLSLSHTLSPFLPSPASVMCKI